MADGVVVWVADGVVVWVADGVVVWVADGVVVWVADSVVVWVADGVVVWVSACTGDSPMTWSSLINASSPSPSSHTLSNCRTSGETPENAERMRQRNANNNMTEVITLSKLFTLSFFT